MSIARISECLIAVIAIASHPHMVVEHSLSIGDLYVKHSRFLGVYGMSEKFVALKISLAKVVAAPLYYSNVVWITIRGLKG